MLVDEHYIPEVKGNKGVRVALVNLNSGERVAAEFLHKQLVANLGDENVLDLFPNRIPAIEAANEFLTSRQPDIVIVAGGDGTVSLALDILDNLRKKEKLPSVSAFVAVLPMGTGNDLSRTLGFGGGYVKPATHARKKFKELLDRMYSSKRIKMDRWSVVMRKVNSPLMWNMNRVVDEQTADTPSDKEEIQQRCAMLNYFSIGFDADIVSQFSTFRDDHPGLCQQRSINKLWYGCFSFGALCTSSPFPKNRIQIRVDGKSIRIPTAAKALVVSNVTTYGGGGVLWKDDHARFAPASVSDGMLEITVLYGVWHAAGVHAGVRKAKKIAQGRGLHIIAPGNYAMQCDGEPIKPMGTAMETIDVRITLLSTTLVLQKEDEEL